MQNDLEYYQNFDTSKATVVKPTLIKKLQANARAARAHALDDDILSWLSSQDQATKQHINDMIRHAMALKPLLSD